MQIHIETGDWKTLQHPCERIRLMVFVAEQGVPKAEEIDDQTAKSDVWLCLNLFAGAVSAVC